MVLLQQQVKVASKKYAPFHLLLYIVEPALLQNNSHAVWAQFVQILVFHASQSHI